MTNDQPSPQRDRSSTPGPSVPPPVGAFRPPAAGPTPGEVADRDAWELRLQQSLPGVQAAAGKWRSGLAAFVALITGGLLIKGPDTASDLADGSLIALTVLVGTGLALNVAGLWLALSAEAGTPARLNYPTIVEKYGGITQFEIVCADRAAGKLRLAKAFVGLALVVLGAAVFTWWWAPVKAEQPAATVKVDDKGTDVCGTLLSADDQSYRIQVPGTSRPTAIPFTDVRNVFVVKNC